MIKTLNLLVQKWAVSPQKKIKLIESVTNVLCVTTVSI